MKDSTKNFVANGLVYGLALFVLSVVIGYFTSNATMQKCLTVAAFSGMAAFFVGGFSFNRFTVSAKKLEDISFPFERSVRIRIECPASFLVDDHIMPGKLFLTDERVLFKHYSTGEAEWWNVADVKPAGFHRAVTNPGGEFVLKTADEVSLVFEVDNLKLWKKAFQQL